MFILEIGKHWDKVRWCECGWCLDCPKLKLHILNFYCAIILNSHFFLAQQKKNYQIKSPQRKREKKEKKGEKKFKSRHNHRQ